MSHKVEASVLNAPRYYDITEDMNTTNIDYEKICRNLWDYMLNYSPDGPKTQFNPKVFIQLFKDCQELLKKDPIVPKVSTSSTVVCGPIYGEGDSLLTLMSQAGFPPKVTYVMLGCYLGHGFAAIECLVFLLSLKMLFPDKVYILKGHHEESISIEMLKIGQLLAQRGVIGKKEMAEALLEIKKTCCLMSAAALLNGNVLCIPGGPGPMLRENGLKYLMDIKKPAKTITEKKILMEAAWSVMIINEAQKDMHGMPCFTQEQVSEFCKKNSLQCLIRGRQMVDEGFLNRPVEVLTLFSAVAYLDNFRNYAAVLKIQGEEGTIIRYKMEEGEQSSLELVKPGIGRNAVV